MRDLIDRQAAIEALDVGAEYFRRVLDLTDIAGVDRENCERVIGLIEAQISDIKELPSAQPKRKKGKWNPFDVPWYQCSICGAVREQKAFMENFCPNCGADMRGEKNDTRRNEPRRNRKETR